MMKRKKIPIIIVLMLMFNFFQAVDSSIGNQTTSIDLNEETEFFDFVIITPEIFSQELISLQTHKEQHGITTKIVTVNDIYEETYTAVRGRDEAEQIKYFLDFAHMNWDTNYVMLVGNKDVIPARYTPECYWDMIHYTISDLYYADLYDEQGQFCSWDSNQDDIFSGKNMSGVQDDVDLYPDIAVGRLLPKDADGLRVVINKIISYEHKVYDQKWFSNVILCGGDDPRMGLRELFVPFMFERKGRMVFEGEYMCDQVAEVLSGFTPVKLYATGWFRPAASFLSVDNINEAIDQGAGFLYFVGHGNPDMAINTNFPFCNRLWLPFPIGYYSSNIPDLRNGEKLPVAVFAGCHCGNFNHTNSPIAWDFIEYDQGGSIASFAATTGSIVVMSSLCTDTLTGFLSMEVFRLFDQGVDIAGDIWKGTITNYLDNDLVCSLGEKFSEINWRHPLGNHYVIEEWALFGDPTLKIGGYQ